MGRTVVQRAVTAVLAVALVFGMYPTAVTADEVLDDSTAIEEAKRIDENTDTESDDATVGLGDAEPVSGGSLEDKDSLEVQTRAREGDLGIVDLTGMSMGEDGGNDVVASANQPASDAISALKSVPGFNAGCSYGSGGCWRFVNAFCQRIYGESAPGGTSGYQLTSPGNYSLLARSVAPSLATAKAALIQGYPGDVVQIRGGSSGYVDWQHTFVLEAVTDAGITIYEHLDSTGVRTVYYDWNTFQSTYAKFSGDESQGVSVYHYNGYNDRFGPVNHEPIGHLDGAWGGAGTAYVSGWTYDPD